MLLLWYHHFMGVKKVIRFKDTDFYFEDCHICQAVAKAEKQGRSLSVEELKQVFDEANRSKEKISFSEKSNSS